MAEAAMTRERALEEAAQLIEQMQETHTSTNEGDRRHLTPRKAGNLAGLAYADGIRALASAQQEPAPAADAENAWIEHIQSNNYDYEYEKIRSAFIAGFAAARAKSGEKGGAR